MREQKINRVAGAILIALSLTALLAVLSGYVFPPPPDEGAAAHIFQLAIVGLVPTLAVFFFTADWKEPLRSLRTLTLPAVTLVAAFGSLYYLEHFR